MGLLAETPHCIPAQGGFLLGAEEGQGAPPSTPGQPEQDPYQMSRMRSVATMAYTPSLKASTRSLLSGSCRS